MSATEAKKIEPTADSDDSKSSDDPRLTSGDSTGFTVSEQRMIDIAQREINKEIGKAGQEIRKDTLTIFGIFAALLTFTVIQVQTVLQVKSVPQMFGIGSFTLGAFLTFILFLHYITSKEVPLAKFIFILIVILIIFFSSFESFWYTTHSSNLWWF